MTLRSGRCCVGQVRLLAVTLLWTAACATETRPYEPPEPPAKESVAPPAIEYATMVLIPEGAFEMGRVWEDPGMYGAAWKENETPAHLVTLGAFWIDIDEVMVEDFALFLSLAAGEKHYDPRSAVERAGESDYQAVAGHERLPMTFVTWLAAAEYCEWLGKRLPTEAQWERAAQGLEPRKFPWGDDGATCVRANYYTGRTYCQGEPIEVGSHSPDGDSPDGLHDMAGNVAEWTADWYGPYGPDPVTEPTGADANWEGRVVRGGGYGETAAAIRTTARWAADPTGASPGIGFRCVAPP